MRKRTKKLTAFALAVVLACSTYLPAAAEEQEEAVNSGADVEVNSAESGRQIINFNTDWHFCKGDVPGAAQEDFDDSAWVYVNLPHSTDFYDADHKDAYQGVSWYRKTFTVDNELKGKEILLTFEGMMQQADIWVNGVNIRTHKGGYIPAVIDLKDHIKYGEENVIAIKIDSRASTEFAPGKTNPDFQYWGGIYGKSFLTVKDPVHITDAVEENVTAGGGIFITAPEVSEDAAEVKVKTEVENSGKDTQAVELETQILDESGETVVSETDTQEIQAGEKAEFEHRMEIDDPRLWSVNTPELYTVRSTVRVDGEITDSVDTDYGIRKVEWTRDGLYINDELTKVNGTNLHTETYMLGNAVPDSAIYDEIREIKENGFDFIRMSVYPHVQAFYDACDKYGVMVLECISGWQYFDDSEVFKNSTYNELRTTIRNHRNHPSIVAWETSLNESNYTYEWAVEMNRIAKEEYPAEGDSYAWTAGCIHWDAFDIGLGTPQARIFQDGNEGAENPKYYDKPILVAEYGDWSYGGTYSTSRVTREKENTYGKKGGDEGMLIQCDNHQESVALMNSKPYVGAALLWDYTDYAGFDPGTLTYCGVVDLYRIPKHSAYFYRSQKDPEIDLSAYGLESGPMVYIANLWDKDADNSEVRIFSNCDTVALYLDGELIGEKGHDTTMWGPHGDISEALSPGEGDGRVISTENLKYPPITFDLSGYEAGKGELRAVGKIDGAEEAVFVRKAPGEAESIQLRPRSETPVLLDGSDAKLVWIDITDLEGTVVTDAYEDVELSVEGPGYIVGPKTVRTRGGQLAVWVKSRRGEGDITVTASAEGLESASVTLPTEEVEGLPEVPEGGDADEYEFSSDVIANIFLGKSASASTENYGAYEYAGNAVDGNDETKWCAGNGDYPQWWMCDLGSETSIESLGLSMETAGSTYYYTVSVSDTPITDENVKDCIVADCSEGSTETEFLFEEPVKGRYVRIDFTQPSNGEWAVLREVYGSGISSNVALNKPVQASTILNGQNAEYANDGRMDTLWCAVGGEGTSDHWFQIDLNDTYALDQVKICFEQENGTYKFVLQGSLDGEHYKDLADFRSGDWCGQQVEIDLDQTVRYLRIYDITTGNMSTCWPCIREIEAYGEETDYTLASVTREKETWASSSREDSCPEYGSNGVPNYYWYPSTDGEEWWMVDTKGIYSLDNIQMTWNAVGEHRYLIEGSLNGINWQTLADRREEPSQDIRPYEPAEGDVRFIRVTLPEGRESGQGFGLFDAYGVAAEERQVKEVIPAEAVEAEAGTPVEDMDLPENLIVILEDDVQTAVPVEWDPESLEVSGAEGTLKGTVSPISGIAMEEQEVSLMIRYSGEEPEEPDTADKTALNMVIAMAEKMEAEQAATGCYTEETWAAVQTALDVARALAADESASQEDVDSAFLELITAVNLLENAVQRVGLEAAIEGAKAILEDVEGLEQYTPESVEALRTALAEAERVYAEEGADQETVNAAARSLMDAVTSLVVVDVDTRLDILIRKAEELLADSDQYTSSSIANLQSALDAAKLVAEDRDATEAEINEAYSALAEAMTSLARKADKSELKTALDKAAEILADSGRYVEDTTEGLQAAADVAQAVYDKEEASPEEVGEAVKSLVDEILKARLMGDVDGNGAVDSADSAEVLKYAAEEQELDDEQNKAADVNGDGAADSTDAAEILKCAAEQTAGF